MENIKPINNFAMEKNTPREIDFSINNQNQSGVSDLSDILFGGSTKSEEQTFKDKFNLPEELDKDLPEGSVSSENLEDKLEHTFDTVPSQVDEKELTGEIEDEEDKNIEDQDLPEIDILNKDIHVYKELIKGLFGDTYDTITVEEDGVEVEKSIDELDLDKETVLDLIKAQLADVQEKATVNKISTEGISDLTRKIIDIDKKGGNVTEALEVYDTFQDPIKDLDLSQEEDQKKLIIYKERLMGTSDEKIAKKLKFYEYDGSVEEEAAAADTYLKNEAETRLQKIEENAIKQKEYEVNALKKYRKDLSSSLDSFELKSSFKKKLLDISSKKNNEGRFELDDLYSKVRANPTESAELILFLADKEEYLKQKLKPQLLSKQIESQRKLKLSRRRTVDSSLPKPKGTSASDFIDIEDLPK